MGTSLINRTRTWRLFVAAGAGLLLLGTAGCGFERIPPGSVGVKFNANSGVSEHIVKPQVVWVNPFTDKLIIYPTGINNATFVKSTHEGDRYGDDSVKASTVEGAILPVDVTVAYRIRSDAASIRQVFNSFGTMELKDIQRDHIRWATVVAVNEVSGKKSIFDLISKERAKFGPEVKAILAPMLDPWGFSVEDVLIREVYPPAEITQKIQEQQAQRADLERARIELKQATIEAQTILTNAQKEAEQNRLLASQGETALALKRIERRRKFIEKWDGHSPLIGTGAIPAM